MARPLPPIREFLVALALTLGTAQAAETENSGALPEPGEDPSNPIVVVEPPGKIQMSEGIPALPIDDIGVSELAGPEMGINVWQGNSFEELHQLSTGVRGVNDPLLRDWLRTLWTIKALPPEKVVPQGAWLRLRLAKLLAAGRTPMAKQLLDQIPESVREASMDGAIADILLLESPLKETCAKTAEMLALRPSPSFQRLSLLCQASEKNTAALELNLTLLEEQNQLSEPMLKDMLRRIAAGKRGGEAKLAQPSSMLLGATAGTAGMEFQESFFPQANTALLRFLTREETAHPATRALAVEALILRDFGTPKNLADAYALVVNRQEEVKSAKALLARAKAAASLETEKEVQEAAALFRKSGQEKALAILLAAREPMKLSDDAMLALIVRACVLQDDLDKAHGWLEANHFVLEETRAAALDLALHVAEKGSADAAALEDFLTLDTTALKDAKAARVATAARIAETLGEALPEQMGALKAAYGPAGPEEATRIQALLASAGAGRTGETLLRIAHFAKSGAWRGSPEAMAAVVSALQQLGWKDEAADLARNILLDAAL
ncbi:MAG: hypothetical protein J0L97_09895 [Alphaproteobacteria bacterium]|nr:hypothetical protein [Alphaproteobacteria bacterium]